MACCCQSILNLCKVNACDSIKTGIEAAQTGVHILVVSFLGVDLKVDAEIDNGEEIIFPATTLNEDYTYTGYILGPDGEKVSMIKDTVSYDCISFQTVINYQTN